MLSLDSVTQSQTFLRPSASFCWSLNLARVYNESLSNGYSCRPGLPELPEFALCPMCTPALLQLLPGVTTASQCFPPNHLHRCHGLDSVVGSPRKQRGLDEDPHKQCQHLQPIKILFFVKSLITYLNSLDHVCVSKGESICFVFNPMKGEKLEI